MGLCPYHPENSVRGYPQALKGLMSNLVVIKVLLIEKLYLV